MTSDHDPILDAALDEVLGGSAPPDLAARILRAWEQGRTSHNGNGQVLPPPVGMPPAVLQPAVLAPPIVSVMPPPPPALVRASAARPAVRGKQSLAGWYSIAGVAAVALLAWGVWFVNRPGPNVAEKEPPKRQEPDPDKPAIVKAIPAPELKPVVPAPPRIEKPAPPPSTIVDVVPPKVSPAPSDPPVSPAPSVEPVQARPHAADVISYVNHDLSATWQAAGVKPAEAATDAEWCRRVFLRVLGRIPTVEELQQYVADKRSNRRQLLADRLIDAELYAEEFAQHWSTVWTNLLIGRTGGADEGDLASREGLQVYLKDSFRRNRPYDKLVQELIGATGSARPGAADFNGAANFMLASLDEDGALATTRVSRLFLGVNLQCAQCHNHPCLDWKQKDYWSLNACFRQMHAEGKGPKARLVNRDFAGKTGDMDEAEVFYQLPNGTMAAAYPRFLDGAELPRSGKLSVVDRRARIAELVAKSKWIAPTVVNRMWGHFFGYGFTGAQDELFGDGQPTHPELLEKLSRDFAASGYDLRSLMRWIVQTDAFSRSSKITGSTLADAPEAGGIPLFSRYYTRQMQAEEVYESLLVAGKLRGQAGKTGDVTQARVQWLAQFSRRMATDDGREESNFDGSFRQALTLMNGELMQRVVSNAQDGHLRGVIDSKLPFDKKVEHLFLAALSRQPTKKELEAVRQLGKISGGNEATTLQDIWWGLLNSNEFILDH